jgi:transposase
MAIFDEQIAVLDQAAEKTAQESEMARLLMTQPGVGPITSLAFVLTLGDVTRFPRGKQVASYFSGSSSSQPGQYSDAPASRGILCP